jgi:hypothetical protein
LSCRMASPGRRKAAAGRAFHAGKPQVKPSLHSGRCGPGACGRVARWRAGRVRNPVVGGAPVGAGRPPLIEICALAEIMRRYVIPLWT